MLYSILKMFQEFLRLSNIFIHISLEMETKVNKILSSKYLFRMLFIWNWKIFLCFCLKFYFFNFLHKWSNITTLYWRCLTLSKSEVDNVDLTLFNVVNLNFDVSKVASTLIWRSPALRRLVNRTTTLKQWWNACWGKISYK